MGDRNDADRHDGLPARTPAGLLAAVAILPALTAVLYPWRDALTLQTVLLLYLLAVVVVAVAGTPASAAAAAVLAFLLVNWFYVPPYHTLVIGRRDNLVALVVFVAVGVITGVLVEVAARRRVEATRAELQRDTMADFTRIPLDEADAAAVLAHIRRTFGLPWVSLEDADQRPLLASGSRPDKGGLIRVPAGQGRALAAAAPATLALDRTSLAQLAAVAERAREAEELVAGTTRLEESERARIALLTAVGHDLRTPLSGIKAAVSALRNREARFTPAQEGELLADIESAADRLGELVANLLDLSRLQTGALVVHPGPVPADEAAAAALLDVPPGRVTLDVPEDLPPLLADPVLLERALANLVANALSHGGGSAVEVAGRAGTRDDGCEVVRLSVVDHGPGVPPDRRAEMLVPFRRLDDSRTGGLGLGMAVVSGFCEAMGVGLDLRGTEGGGLTVELSVPVVRREPA